MLAVRYIIYSFSRSVLLRQRPIGYVNVTAQFVLQSVKL